MATFFGASIIDFNIKGGWGNAETILDINIAECTNETFAPPDVWTPALFQYGDFQFFGLTDTYRKDFSSGGFPVYSMQMTNGIAVLGGVELILNDYFGVTNVVPNLINVFGYLENGGGFGYSGVNNAGMSWTSIASAVSSIVNGAGNDYGGPISHSGFKYGIDLSSLPGIPAYYRINSDNINLLDFIGEVCEAGGYDFFIKLMPGTGGLNGIFKVVTISRIAQPTTGQIIQFIEAADCVVAKSYGLESRKAAYSKFVVGANLERMYFNYLQNTGDADSDGSISQLEYANDTILPYFGEDINGDMIIGWTPKGQPSEYLFSIDISDMKTPLNESTYITSLAELRAAKMSESSWELFLAQRNSNKYMIDHSGEDTDFFLYNTPYMEPTGVALTGVPDFKIGDYYALPKMGWAGLVQKNKLQELRAFYPPPTPTPSGIREVACLKYPHDGVLNPYFQRAARLKISTGFEIGFARMFESDLYEKAQLNPTLALIYQQSKETLGGMNNTAYYMNKNSIENNSRFKDIELGNLTDTVKTKLYRKLKDLADNFYNKRFAISIPFTYATYEPESNNIRMSQEIADDGFLDESVWPTAYSAGLIPDISGINTLISEEYKFYPFTKYEDCVIVDSSGGIYDVKYNFSDISEGDKIFSAPRPSGSYSIYDAWIKCGMRKKIVFQNSSTLYGPRAILEVPGAVKIQNPPFPSYIGALYSGFSKHAKMPGGVFYADSGVDTAFANAKLDKIGMDEVTFHDGEEIVYADLYAIPLRSKLLSYGPWYAVGADGKVVYERNQDLNPWNYGGFAAMNNAGEARVMDGITNQTLSEIGSVTLPGAPTMNFGDRLTAEGPYVTDMTISVGSQGVTTAYNFQAWSSHRSLSKLNNYNTDRLNRLSKVSRDIRSNFREGLKNGRYKGAGDFYNKISNRIINLNEYSRKDIPSTSHRIIAGENNGTQSNVVIQPFYNAASQAAGDYENKAFMSLDGLLRPYSTSVHKKLSNFEPPENLSEDVSSITLNPFGSGGGHDIQIVSDGTTMREHGMDGGSAIGVEMSGDFPVFRGMGLKLPAVGVGWGFTIDGRPVPESTGTPNVYGPTGTLIKSGTPPDPNEFLDGYLYKSDQWKSGPIDFRWDQARGVWTAGTITSIYLVKLTNLYNPACFSFEVDRATTRAQYTRAAPSGRLMFDKTGVIHDPEYLAYTGNVNNTGCYEHLNFKDVEYPYYEAFIIRKTNEDSSVDGLDYNIWYDDCNDCGHVTNQCANFTKHGSPSAKKKILIENPLRQSFDVGDLAFTVDTGRKQRVSGSTFAGGSGVGASGHFLVDATGYLTFVLDVPGSGYTNGAFAVYRKPCVGLTLTTASGAITGYTISGDRTGHLPTGIYPVSIYPKNASLEYEELPIHWVTQAEFKSQQFVTHVDCDNGILQTCTIKGQLQGFKSCEHCGENSSLINNFL